MKSFFRNTRAIGPVGPLVVVLLTGCASLDPSADIRDASALIATRANTETGWTEPWFENADAWDGSAALSSDVAVRVALQNNRAIRRQVETIVTSRADFVQAHLLPNPVVNFAYGFPTDSLGGEPLTVGVVQQLAWIWTRPTAINTAEAELRGQILAVSDAALSLVAAVRRSHANVYFAEEAARLQGDNVALFERSHELLRELFSVGEVARLDLNRVELEVRAAEVRLADRELFLAEAKRDLLDLLGRAGAGVDWLATYPTPGVGGDLDEVDAVQLAATQRLDLAAAYAVVEARAANVDRSERGRLPDVDAGVGYQQNFSNRPGVFPAVGITPKLFDDNSARIAKAESELRQARITADKTRQTAINETRQAWVALRTQQRVVHAYEDNILALARSNVSLAEAAFAVGESDLTVLLEAERQLNAAQVALVDRQRGAAGALIELERAVGGSLVPQPMVTDAIARRQRNGEATP